MGLVQACCVSAPADMWQAMRGCTQGGGEGEAHLMVRVSEALFVGAGPGAGPGGGLGEGARPGTRALMCVRILSCRVQRALR